MLPGNLNFMTITLDSVYDKDGNLRYVLRFPTEVGEAIAKSGIQGDGADDFWDRMVELQRWKGDKTTVIVYGLALI